MILYIQYNTQPCTGLRDITHCAVSPLPRLPAGPATIAHSLTGVSLSPPQITASSKSPRVSIRVRDSCVANGSATDCIRA